VTGVTERRAARRHIQRRVKTKRWMEDMTGLSNDTFVKLIGSGLLVWAFALVAMLPY